MSMGRRPFNIAVNETGNAKERFEQIDKSIKDMGVAASATSKRLRSMGQSLSKATDEISDLRNQTRQTEGQVRLNAEALDLQNDLLGIASIATDALRTRQQELSDAGEATTEEQAAANEGAKESIRLLKSLSDGMSRVADSGKFTSSRLRELGREFEFLATEEEDFREGFLEAGVELENLAGKFKVVEQSVASMTNVANAGIGRVTNAQGRAQIQAKQLSDEFQKLSSSGSLTTNTLLKLSRRADAISQTAAPTLSKRLSKLSEELRDLAVDNKVLDEQLAQTGRRFGFMEDVSDEAAKAMRTVSAAAQGFMLSSSLLEKNITGLAFSLIFLQFSGALKTSLAFAGLSFAALGAWKSIQKVSETQTGLRTLENSIGVITRNTDAFGLAQSEARRITEGLGVSFEKEEEFINALTEGIIKMREVDIEPAGKALLVFTSAFALLRVQGKDVKTAIGGALESVKAFDKGTANAEIPVGDLTRSFEELMTDLPLSVKVINELPGAIETSIEASKGSFSKLTGFLSNLETEVGEWWGRLVLGSETFDAGLEAWTQEGKPKAEIAQLFEIDIPDSIEVTRAKMEELTLAAIEAKEALGGLPSTSATLHMGQQLGPAGGFQDPFVVDPYGKQDLQAQQDPFVVDPYGKQNIPGFGSLGGLIDPFGGDANVIINITGNFTGTPEENGRELGRVLQRATRGSFGPRQV